MSMMQKDSLFLCGRDLEIFLKDFEMVSTLHSSGKEEAREGVPEAKVQLQASFMSL